MMEKAKSDFHALTSLHLARERAPGSIRLPDVFYRAAQELLNGNAHHEHSILIGRNLEITWRQQGQPDTVRNDAPPKLEAQGLALIHAHPTEPGVHDGDDLAFFAELKGPRMTAVVDLETKQVSLVVRTQEFDDVRRAYAADGKDLGNAIRETWNRVYKPYVFKASGYGFLWADRSDKAVARILGTKEVCKQFGLVFYQGEVGFGFGRKEPPVKY